MSWHDDDDDDDDDDAQSTVNACDTTHRPREDYCLRGVTACVCRALCAAGLPLCVITAGHEDKLGHALLLWPEKDSKRADWGR